jgi:putative membrane-bound dehydrogenase-like protein
MANSFRAALLVAAFGSLSVLGWSLLAAADPKPAPSAASAAPASETDKSLDPAELLKQDFKANLPRIAPTEPADALKTFTVAPGFRLEQVAAEPLVNSPVAMEFDENGRAYVCEMRGYSENRNDGVSRVSLLDDTDGDGRFDKSTVFADKLFWPTAIFPYDGGLFVGDAPEVWYFKDTDGDGKADVKKHVFTGFGTSNVQGLLNCFRWRFDNRIELATSSVGGMVRKASDPESKAVNVRGRDIAFDPKTYDFELTSGASQHGMSFDDWGHKFVSSNSNHLQQVMYEDRYVARNPYLSAPDARLSIAADGPQAEVFRTSPVEPWRIIRTQLRVSGAVRGAVEGGGRAAGYFTGAGGVTIYRGDAFPAEWRGIVIVGDVGSNLVHRKRLEPNGLEFIGRRIDEKSEFVSSTDIWFRPAQYANAPDGTLYIMDVYREVIEHPDSLPPMIKQHLDLTAGRDRGRIYRVVPEGYKQRAKRKLGEATTAELVALLEHPNAWHRETAARLISTRQDKSAVEPLKKLVAESKSPLGRVHSLYSLDGLGAVEESDCMQAIQSTDAEVCRHGIKIAERWLRRNNPETTTVNRVASAVAGLAEHSAIEVRYQVAFSLGEIIESRWSKWDRHPENYVPPGDEQAGYTRAFGGLLGILRRDVDDRWMRTAVQSSLGRNPAGVIHVLSSDEQFLAKRGAASIFEALAAQTAAQNELERVEVVVDSIGDIPDEYPAATLAVIRGLSQALKRPDSAVSKLAAAGKLARMDEVVGKMLAVATKTALDDGADVKKRVAAIDELGLGKFAALQPTLVTLVDSRKPVEVQLAAVAAIGKFADRGVAEVLLKAFPALSPQVRESALEAIFARPERIAALLDAVEAKKFAASDVPPARVQLLTRSGTPELRDRAQKLLGAQTAGRRADVVASYREALKLTGDVARGRALFQKNCNACHRTENKGTEIGPNLVAIKTRGPESILTNVLDPSREVNPLFVNYLCTTDDGRTITGLISAESATAVTLKRAEGQSDTVLRVNIEELVSTGLSIMPEGLEKQIDVQGMADVIAYLMQVE